MAWNCITSNMFDSRAGSRNPELPGTAQADQAVIHLFEKVKRERQYQ